MSGIYFLLIVICFFVFIIVKANVNNKNNEEKKKSEFITNYGKANTRVYKTGELERISIYAKHRESKQTVDDLTWNDLDMDLIYQHMAYTESSLGDDYLYYLLKNPVKEQDVLLDRERKITMLSDNPDLRSDLQVVFASLGRMERFSLAQYIAFLMRENPKNNAKHYVVDALIVVSIIIIILHVGLGLGLFFILILYNVFSYFKDKAYFKPYLASIRYLFKVLDKAAKVEKLLPMEWEKSKEEIGKIVVTLNPIRKNSYLVMSHGRMGGEGFEVIFDYLRMCLHLDIIKFNHMLKGLQQYEEELWSLYEILGEMDAYIAVGQYRTYLGKTCSPSFILAKEMEMIDGYHPLLENPVVNTIQLEKNILLTGSNASGKSTFLKTVGVNVLLAQTIHTCMAKELKMPICKVFSSMSLKDSITLKESYYMAEIKSIKRILNSADNGNMIICMIDEVLRGTNTVERIAASTQILKSLSRPNVLCIAATHDVELTKTLENQYENYHFEESMKQGDIEFSYRLMEGRAKSCNAINLLEHLGYDKDLILNARYMVNIFETQGEWICE